MKTFVALDTFYGKVMKQGSADLCRHWVRKHGKKRYCVTVAYVLRRT
jgi:hypothetical protein